MKILVTGGAGFIGSHIVDAYVKLGHKVVIVDNLYTGKKKNINPKVKFYKADIRNAKLMAQIFKKERFNVVSHHAAQMDVRKSVADPVFDAQVNILGLINILECARQNKVKKVIFASSGGTIYGECGKLAPKEGAPSRPDSPYGITKRASEYYLRCYEGLYGLKFTSLRYGNVYGPRQDPHGEAGVVAIFSNRILAGENVFIFGNGKQMRDYVSVNDVVDANVLALKKGDNQIINIGTNQATSVNKLFSEMAGISGYKKPPVYKPARAGELYKSFLDITKAKKVLGWKPKLALKTGLKDTIEYFK